LAAGFERKLDVPEAGDFESVPLGMACQCAPVADLLVEFVDGHGWWCRLTSRTYSPVAQVQQEKTRPRK
jgi:hypothetical protein